MSLKAKKAARQAAPHDRDIRADAYFHARAGVDLIDATRAWVSETLCREVFGDLSLENTGEENTGEENTGQENVEHTRHPPSLVIDRLTTFAREHPEFGRVWLYELLNSAEPEADPFWNRYLSTIDRFIESNAAMPECDVAERAMALLIGIFLRPEGAISGLLPVTPEPLPPRRSPTSTTSPH